MRSGRAGKAVSWAAAALAAATVLASAGCSSIGGFAGAVAGVASGSFSSNPAVGVAVGISVKAATDDAMQNWSRGLQSDEQDRIAEIAGQLEVGERRSWQIHHLGWFGDEHGELQVTGAIDNALAVCKEVMFSVAGGKAEAPTASWFVTQACLQADGHWRWAAAEPAVMRWGNLQ